MIEVGDVAPLQVSVTDSTGAPADCTTMTLAITLPDLAGTVKTSPTDFALTHTAGTGIYRYDFPTTIEGPHSFVWTGTGANATTHRDMINVERNLPALVSTDEALAHMRASTAITSYPDVEYLRWLIKLSTRSVEDDLRRVLVRRSVTDTFDGNTSTIILRRTPVLQVTSLTENGSTLAAGTDYVLDSRLGKIYRGTATAPRSFAYGLGAVVVTYDAGYLIPPTITRQVTLRNIQRLWQQSQQMPHPSMDDLDAEARLFTPSGVLTPVEMSAYSKLRVRQGFA